VELREALSQIAEIRLRMAETEVFRGYRSIPVAASGIMAIIAALGQSNWIIDPHGDILAYCTLWIGVAVVSVIGAGLTMLLRDWLGGASQTREMTLLAVSQLIPSVAAGALLTAVFVHELPESVGLLPGLWQVFFSLGLFASCRLLPRASFWVALFYLLSGATTLSLARNEWALNPWAMGLPFGVGQLFAAAVLYWNLERTHEQ